MRYFRVFNLIFVRVSHLHRCRLAFYPSMFLCAFLSLISFYVLHMMVSVLFSFRHFVSGLYFHTLGVCYFWFSCARVSSANWYTPCFGFIYTFVRVSRSNFTFERWDVQDMLVEVHLIVDKAWDLARISEDILPEDWSLYGEYKCST